MLISVIKLELIWPFLPSLPPLFHQMPGNVRNTGQNDSHRTPITSAARTKSLDCLADKSVRSSLHVSHLLLKKS